MDEADIQDYGGERSERILTDESRGTEEEGEGNDGHDGRGKVLDGNLNASQCAGKDEQHGTSSSTEEAGAERKRKRSGKRANAGAFSEEEKAKASRDRNREHARNTRIRKKQYVENLKHQVEEMLQAKARDERDDLLASSRMAAERGAQRQTVLNMFYLRATEDLSPLSWSSILDDKFTCITPITPYRSFPPSELRDDHRLITGIDGMIRDTASLAVFIQSIGQRSQNQSGQKVKYQFYTSPEDTIVAADAESGRSSQLMCRWMMKTENASECGAQCEVFSHGMLRVRFSSDNRIRTLELAYDVMSFMQQLQRALGHEEFRVVPNTLEAAMQPSRHARLICQADMPFGITYVNDAWTALIGRTKEEVQNQSVFILKGSSEAGSDTKLETFVQQCMAANPKRAGLTELQVMTKDMRRFQASIQAYPLGNSAGDLDHFLLVMEEVPVCTGLAPPGLDLFPFV